MARIPLHFTRWMRIISIYLLLAAAMLCIAPWFGPTHISPAQVAAEVTGRQHSSIQSTVFFHQRLPRVLLGFCVGAALGLAGAAFQVLLRNPLATPYTLGVASAGTMAATIAIVWPALYISFGPFTSTHIFALAGSFGAAAFIMLLSRYARVYTGNFIILAGIALNLFCASAILFIRFLADPNHLVAVDRWIMGGLQTAEYWEVAGIALFLLAGGVLILLNTQAINQLLFGQEMAGSRGVNTKAVFLRVMAGGVLLTTGAVAVAGPIGFVGLIVPHAVRMLSGADQRIVLPASALSAGIVLVVCDTIARTCVAPTEIPVGIITACFGAPLFLLLLIRSQRMQR